MNFTGYGLSPRNLVLRGTRSPRAEEGLARHTGLATAAEAGDAPSLEGLLLLLCPEDGEELSGLLEEIPELPAGKGTMIAVLTGTGMEAMQEGRYLLLPECDLTFRLLAAIPGYLVMAMRDGGLRRTPLWQVTGALLPFFVHNMNNLLARIMGNAELARMYCGRPEEAGRKLDSALAGVEEMRAFVRNLAALSVNSGADSAGTPAFPAELERTARMFCGRSVDLTFRTAGDFRDAMSIQSTHLRLAARLLSASAAVMVNGSGSILIEAELLPEGLRVGTGWTAGAGGSSGLVEDGEGAAVDLMAVCAAVCAVSGLGMKVERWDSVSGGAWVRSFPDVDGGRRGR